MSAFDGNNLIQQVSAITLVYTDKELKKHFSTDAPTVFRKCADRIQQVFGTYKVFVDCGHGGDDNGAAWGNKYDYLEEDDLNLIIGFLLRYELQLEGFEVKMSRERDEFVSLSKRVEMANSWGADIFVSIHADAFHKITAKGISTHIYTHGSSQSLLLGTWIQTGLIKKFMDHTNRGVKKSNFYIIRESWMPAVLVECEFISNPETRRFLKEPENQIALAKGIKEGIVKYNAGRRK